MDTTRILMGILILFVTTYFTRMLPLLLFRGQIKNKFIRSLLAYLPYAILTSLLFPEVLSNPEMGVIPGTIGFIVALILAFRNRSLIVVLASATVATYIFMLLNPYIMPYLQSFVSGI